MGTTQWVTVSLAWSGTSVNLWHLRHLIRMIRRHDLTNKYKDKYNDNDKWHWLQFWQLGIWIWQLWHWTAFAILAMFLHFVENNFYLLEMGRSNMVVPEKQTYKSNQSSECLFPISKYTQTGIGHEQPQFDVPLCWNWKGHHLKEWELPACERCWQGWGSSPPPGASLTSTLAASTLGRFTTPSPPTARKIKVQSTN